MTNSDTTLTSGIPSNPTTLRTSTTPRCGYCAALLIAKGELYWCGVCGVWFEVREVEIPPATTMV